MEVDSIPGVLESSTLDFRTLSGCSLSERLGPYTAWVLRRHEHQSWPYGRVLSSRAGHTVSVRDKHGDGERVRCINFGSQDYLGLAQDLRLHEAAVAAIEEYGIHSAGSPALCGRTALLLELEQRLASELKMANATVLPTGWAAGFGVVTALVRPSDAVVMDKLSHNCLYEGAYHATRNVYRFNHNSMESFEGRLAAARKEHPDGGLFAIVESLYSMDADSPDLQRVLHLCEKYNAISIVDVAHDFGAMGEHGLGLLESLSDGSWPDVIMGSFSKTFGANGGFIAGPECLRDYIQLYAPSQTFSNAISPIQTSVVLKACEIIFSGEGSQLRSRLADNVKLLREEMVSQGLEVRGMPCPIVPVFVGDERLARLTYRALNSRNLLANMVEHPGVAKGQARFRFQVMANHKATDIVKSAAHMRDAKDEAEAELLSGARC